MSSRLDRRASLRPRRARLAPLTRRRPPPLARPVRHQRRRGRATAQHRLSRRARDAARLLRSAGPARSRRYRSQPEYRPARFGSIQRDAGCRGNDRDRRIYTAARCEPEIPECGACRLSGSIRQQRCFRRRPQRGRPAAAKTRARSIRPIPRRAARRSGAARDRAQLRCSEWRRRCERMPAGRRVR